MLEPFDGSMLVWIIFVGTWLAVFMMPGKKPPSKWDKLIEVIKLIKGDL